MIANRSRTGLIAAAALTVALVTGCSNSTPAAEKKSDASPAKVTVGLIGASAGQLPLYAAIEQGFLAEKNIEVEIISFSGGGAQAITALASGDVGMLITGAPSFISATGNGTFDGKIFYQFAANAFDIVGKPDVSTLDEVIGQPVAVSGIGSQDQIWFEYAVEKAGYDPEQFDYAVTGGVPDRIAGLINGGFAAAALPAPFRAQYEDQTTVLIDGDEAGNILPALMIGSMTEYLDENESTVQQFVEALNEGSDWTRDAANTDTAVEYCVEFTGAPEATCASTLESFIASPADGTFSSNGAVDTAGVESIIEIAARLNDFKTDITVDDVVDTRFTK